MSLRQTKEFPDRLIRVAAVGQNQNPIDRGKTTRTECQARAMYIKSFKLVSESYLRSALSIWLQQLRLRLCSKCIAGSSSSDPARAHCACARVSFRALSCKFSVWVSGVVHLVLTTSKLLGTLSGWNWNSNQKLIARLWIYVRIDVNLIKSLLDWDNYYK